MSEILQQPHKPIQTQATTTSTTQGSKRFKLVDMFMFIAVLSIIAILGLTLLNKLSLKNEVAAARLSADRVLNDIKSNNAKDALSVSNIQFKTSHSQTQIQTIFQSAALYTSGIPSVVSQTVTNDKAGKIVVFIYEYNSKSPYYFRIAVEKINTKWLLLGLSGNPDQTQLNNL